MIKNVDLALPCLFGRRNHFLSHQLRELVLVLLDLSGLDLIFAEEDTVAVFVIFADLVIGLVPALLLTLVLVLALRLRLFFLDIRADGAHFLALLLFLLRLLQCLLLRGFFLCCGGDFAR